MIKKNDTMSFAGKWMDPDISMLSKINQNLDLKKNKIDMNMNGHCLERPAGDGRGQDSGNGRI